MNRHAVNVDDSWAKQVLVNAFLIPFCKNQNYSIAICFKNSKWCAHFFLFQTFSSFETIKLKFWCLLNMHLRESARAREIQREEGWKWRTKWKIIFFSQKSSKILRIQFENGAFFTSLLQKELGDAEECISQEKQWNDHSTFKTLLSWKQLALWCQVPRAQSIEITIPEKFPFQLKFATLALQQQQQEKKKKEL